MTYRDSVIGQQIIERLMPFNANSQAQIVVRSAFDRASAGYSLLSPASKSKWKAFGALDLRRDPVTARRYSLTGRQSFMGLATKFALANPGQSFPQNPPTVKFAGDAIGVTCAAGTGKLTFTASGKNAEGVITELLVQRLASPDRAPTMEGYRSAGYKAFSEGGSTFQFPCEPAIYATAYRFVSAASGEERGIVPIGVTTVSLALAEGGTDAATKPARAKRAA